MKPSIERELEAIRQLVRDLENRLKDERAQLGHRETVSLNRRGEVPAYTREDFGRVLRATESGVTWQTITGTGGGSGTPDGSTTSVITGVLTALPLSGTIDARIKSLSGSIDSRFASFAGGVVYDGGTLGVVTGVLNALPLSGTVNARFVSLSGSVNSRLNNWNYSNIAVTGVLTVTGDVNSAGSITGSGDAKFGHDVDVGRLLTVITPSTTIPVIRMKRAGGNTPHWGFGHNDSTQNLSTYWFDGTNWQGPFLDVNPTGSLRVSGNLQTIGSVTGSGDAVFNRDLTVIRNLYVQGTISGSAYLNVPTGSGGGTVGPGTANRIPKFATATTLSDSIIREIPAVAAGTVSQDATSLKYLPASNTEWDTLVAGSGLVRPNYGLWLMQESTGALADSTGNGNSFVPSGAGHAWQQSKAGWTRKFVTLADNLTNNWTIASAPTPNTTSFLIVMFVAVQSTPAATRTIFEHPNHYLEVTSTPRFQSNAGGTVTSSTDPTTTVHTVILKHDISRSHDRIYIDGVETLSPPFFNSSTTGPLSLGHATIGGTSTAPVAFGYAAAWSGASAEMSDSQVATLFSLLQNGPPSSSPAYTLVSGALAVSGSITGSGDASFLRGVNVAGSFAVSGSVYIGDSGADQHFLTGALNANGTAGVNGQVMTIVSGVPQWATSTAFSTTGTLSIDVTGTVAGDKNVSLEGNIDWIVPSSASRPKLYSIGNLYQKARGGWLGDSLEPVHGGVGTTMTTFTAQPTITADPTDSTANVSLSTNNGARMFMTTNTNTHLNWGFAFRAPADTTIRTLRLYTGHFSCRLDVSASLSDGSAAMVVAQDEQTAGNSARKTWTIIYNSSKPAELIVQMRVSKNNLSGTANCGIVAITLSSSTGF